MARKRRASMREGPLADLFRSTEESVGPEEVKVTAANGTEPAAKKTAKPRPQKRSGEARQQDGGEPAAAVAEVEQVVEEVVTRAAPELETAEPGVAERAPEPPAEKEGEEQEVRAYRVTEEPSTVERKIEHEGLERLMGNAPDAVDERPAFGRDEPDTTQQGGAPRTHQAVLRVVGVGGAGVNAVNRMIEAQLPGVEFVAINTDLQSLQLSKADVVLQIGAALTRGLGSGSDPRVGYRAAFDEQDRIKELLKGSDMVFVTAGTGGGTGTGAAPVIAKLARDVGALTVGIVSKPFSFEGARRAAQAEEGVAALGAEVDTMIVVPNERLLEILERRTSITDAFQVADDVLRQAVQGISDLVTLPGVINLDFADVRTTMLEAGDAILGIGMGIGEHRAVLAAEKAVSSPLLETSVEGARSLLLSVTGGPDLSLIEASEAAKVVQEAGHPEANIIFGANIDDDLTEQVWVTVIATRFDSAFAHRHWRDRRGPSFDESGRGRDRAREPRDDLDPPFSSKEQLASLRDRDPTPPGSGVLHVEPPEFIPGH